MEESNCGILVDPADPQEVADAIIYLMEHPKETEEMGSNGRRAVEEKYNWESMERELLQIYADLDGS